MHMSAHTGVTAGSSIPNASKGSQLHFLFWSHFLHCNYLVGTLKCTPISDVKELILELNEIQYWMLLGRELKIEQGDLEQWKVSAALYMFSSPDLPALLSWLL